MANNANPETPSPQYFSLPGGVDVERRVRQPGPPGEVDVSPPVTNDPALSAVIGEGRLVSLYDDAGWSEGCVWWPHRQQLVWSDIAGRRLLGWRDDGSVDIVLDGTFFINGNTVDPAGNLLHCEHGRRAVSQSTSTAEATDIPRLMACHANGDRLNAPNDIICARDGTIWFTEPTMGLEKPSQGFVGSSESGRTSVCRLRKGEMQAERMADMTQPNGLAFSPDEQTLYVSQTPEDDSKEEVGIYALSWDGVRLGQPELFIRVPQGLPDGFKTDPCGRLWTTSGTGIQIYSPGGQWLGNIPTPHLCSNCAFDERYERLFIAALNKLLMIPLQQPASHG